MLRRIRNRPAMAPRMEPAISGRGKTNSGDRGDKNRLDGSGPGRNGGYRVEHLQSALGICVIILLAWIFSEDRSAFRWRLVVSALLLQLAIALLLLKFPPARA